MGGVVVDGGQNSFVQLSEFECRISGVGCLVSGDGCLVSEVWRGA